MPGAAHAHEPDPQSGDGRPRPAPSRAGMPATSSRASARPTPVVAPLQYLPVLRPATCRWLRMLPIARSEHGLLLGVADPTDARPALVASALTGLTVQPVAIDWALAERLLDGAESAAGPAPTRPRRELQSVPATSTSTPAPPMIGGGAPQAPAPSPTTTNADGEPLLLGELLLQADAISPLDLRHALDVQQRTGDPLGRLLTHLGLATAEAVAEALATQHGATLATDPALLIPAPAALELVPEATCRRHQVLPLRVEDDRLVLAMVDPTDPDAATAVGRYCALPVECIVTTEPALVDAMRTAYRDSQTEISVHGLLNRKPAESAHVVLCRWQKFALAAGAVWFLAWLAAAPVPTIMCVAAISMGFYTTFAAFKARAVIASFGHDPELSVTTEEAAALQESELPIYTVLVPLYKESAILPRLVSGLCDLDYPPAKLDVKLLLEEDDVETVAAARAMDLPSFVDVVVTPDSQPKTKPKSCNYGLLYARGEYAVIFDAEDVPERDQLRKAVAAFRKAPPDIVCLQGQLNYYNRDQNLLTKWFTGEYSGWFDLFVPGLDNIRMPIPLGGTSNHFVTDVLVELGAWDPFNVTEDADLGIRLFNAGYRTAALNSTTFEEANSETFNWIRQRSRWVKGYMQTWLVHMRRPVHAAKAVGIRNFIGFQLVIAGTFFVLLLNPVQWAILLLWCLTQANLVRELFPGALYYIAWVSFLLGNFTFVYINVIAVLRRRYWNLVGAAILSPLYWGLMSIAAWRGLIQLITAPSYWEKTEHGLDDGSAHERAVEAQAVQAQAVEQRRAA